MEGTGKLYEYIFQVEKNLHIKQLEENIKLFNKLENTHDYIHSNSTNI